MQYFLLMSVDKIVKYLVSYQIYKVVTLCYTMTWPVYSLYSNFNLSFLKYLIHLLINFIELFTLWGNMMEMTHLKFLSLGIAQRLYLR